MNNYYTAAEAIQKLNIPKSTFYHLARIGKIPGRFVMPLRENAFYAKSEIDKLVLERAKVLGEQTTSNLIFVPPNYNDLVQLADIKHALTPYINSISPEEQLSKLQYNPEAIIVLKDSALNFVLGGVIMSPLNPNILGKLIRLEIAIDEVSPKEYRPYSTKEVQDCYIADIVSVVGSNLLRVILNYLIEKLESGYSIKHIYTVTNSEDGDRLARSLGFKLLRERLGGNNSRRSYVLDLETNENQSRFVCKYLEAKSSQNRRLLRQKDAVSQFEVLNVLKQFNKQIVPGYLLNSWRDELTLPQFTSLGKEFHIAEAHINVSLWAKDSNDFLWLIPVKASSNQRLLDTIDKIEAASNKTLCIIPWIIILSNVDKDTLDYAKKRYVLLTGYNEWQQLTEILRSNK